MSVNPGSRFSGQYVTYNGARIPLQQGYGLFTAPRTGYVPVTFRGKRMWATKSDFALPNAALAKAAARRI